jgi:hypothetical protein
MIGIFRAADALFASQPRDPPARRFLPLTSHNFKAPSLAPANLLPSGEKARR